MHSKLLRHAFFIAAVTLLGACSGPGEGDPDYVPPDDAGNGSSMVGEVASITLIFSSTPLPTTADTVEDGVSVRAIVTDNRNRTVPGAVIAFASTSGALIVGDSTTDETGSVAAVLTTGGDATQRTIEITATAQGTKINASKTIEVSDAVAPPPSAAANIRLISDTEFLPGTAASVGEGASLFAIVTDSSGNLIPDQSVAFSVTAGYAALSVGTQTTDQSGTAQAILTTGGDSTPRAVTVAAVSGPVSSSLTLDVRDQTGPADQVTRVTVAADRDNLRPTDSTFADAVTLTATPVDTSGNVLSGVPVRFAITAGGGAIRTVASTTDETGQSTALLTTGGDPSLRTITVQVSAGEATATTSIVVAASAITNKIVLTADRAMLATTDFTSDTGVTLSAQLTDSAGNVVAGQNVSFAITAGGGAIQPVNGGATSDAGVAQARLTTGGDPSIRTITITASIGDKSAAIDIPVTSDGGVAAKVDQLILSGNRSTLLTTDATLSNALVLTATVTDTGGRALAGAAVDFVITSYNGVLTIDSASTDGSGQATARLTTGGNTSERTIVVTATSAGRTDSVNVPVIAPGSLDNLVDRIAVSSNRGSLAPTDDTLEEGVVLYAQLLDSAGVAISGARASFSIASGGGALAVENGGLTDDSGIATATLTTGGDPTERPITVSVISGAASQTYTVPVVQINGGAASRVNQIVLSAPTTTLYDDQDTPAEGVRLTAQLLDANSAAVEGAAVQMAITAGTGAIIQQDTNSLDGGIAEGTVTIGADRSAHHFTITVTSGTASSSLVFSVVERVASIRLIAAQPSVPSAAETASEAVTVTALISDSNNRRVEGVSVDFASDSGSLVIVASTTDSAGQAAAAITTDGDPSPRTITVTASAGNQSAAIALPVTGTSLTLESDTAFGSGETETVVAIFKNSDAEPIVGANVQLVSAVGNPISPSAAQTNTAGIATFEYTAVTGGEDTLSATTAGLVATRDVTVSTYRITYVTPDPDSEIALDSTAQVTLKLTRNTAAAPGETVSVSATRGTVTPSTVTTNSEGEASVNILSSGAGGAGGSILTATGPEGILADLAVEFVATEAESISVQALATNVAFNETTNIKAVVRDKDGNFVKNAGVTFSITDPSGGGLSRSTAVTDSLGTANVTYNAGPNSSGADGVVIKAATGGKTAKVNLTVGGIPVRIVLGTGNTISSNDIDTLYTLPFTAIVTDSGGNPVTGNNINVRVQSSSYQKGYYVLVDTDDDGIDDAWATLRTAPPQTGSNFGCLNEDTDLDGVLDPGEDFNTNAMLDPGNVASAPSSVALDSEGQADFEISYPQDVANWVLVTVYATTSVSGTETTVSKGFVLPASADDLNDIETAPPGYISPFGTANSCQSPL